MSLISAGSISLDSTFKQQKILILRSMCSRKSATNRNYYILKVTCSVFLWKQQKRKKNKLMFLILKSSTFLKLDIIPGGIKQSHVGAP
jgi:hypothetical protein